MTHLNYQALTFQDTVEGCAQAEVYGAGGLVTRQRCGVERCIPAVGLMMTEAGAMSLTGPLRPPVLTNSAPVWS